MKKHILNMTIVSILAITSAATAMEKEKGRKQDRSRKNEKSRSDKTKTKSAQRQPRKEPAQQKIKTSLTAKQQDELTKAVQGIKDKPLSESRKEQLIIQKYGDLADAGDQFAKAKIKEASQAYKLKKYGPNYRDIDDYDSDED